MKTPSPIPAALLTLALSIGTAAMLGAWSASAPRLADARPPAAGHRELPDSTLPASAWLGLLPEGEEKRRFVLDCTGCHVFDSRIAWGADSAPRSAAQWRAIIERMLGFAGANSGFPVIAADRDAAATAEWLARHITRPPATSRDVLPMPAGVTVTEHLMPVAQDLPHDVAIDSSGKVLITGMFSNRIYVLDPASGVRTEVAIPVQRANPRAIELSADGRWWVVLGAPNAVAEYDPVRREWRSHAVGMYAHSVAVGRDGRAWFNGHFTRAPELIGAVDPQTGTVRTHEVPPHPTLAARPGGPIPYELRAAPDGRIWLSELAGNRLLAFDPASRQFRTFEMPVSHSGPRRFDIDARGIVWIPAYAANALVWLDPASGRFESIPMPHPDAVPYVVRVDDRRGRLWIGTSANDVLYRYEPASRRFTAIPLPSRGALVRHLAIEPRSGDVWVAYGASPGIAARVARVEVR